MKSLVKIFILCLLSFMLFACQAENEKQTQKTIAVIPKGTTHVFWQSVHAGALKAGREMGVEIVWVGTEKEDDRQQQIALVDNQVMSGVDGIVLAPLDAVALRRPVQNAVDKGIPVIIIDSDLDNAESLITSFIATDNRMGGRLAGKEMATLLKGKGNVAVLRYNEGSASTENREEGFLEAIKEYPGITVVSSEQYGGVTRATAQQASENLLLRFKDDAGNITIDGVFAPNTSTTYGLLQALKRQNQAGKVHFIGFDSDEPLIEGLKRNELNGLVVQDPFKMGYLGVIKMMDKINGRPVEKRIDTGVTFVRISQLELPEIQELINPDLGKWLNP